LHPQSIRHSRFVWAVLALLALGLQARVALAQTTTGATFGDVIQLPGGTPSDVVLDESRHQLYLINNNTNLVYLFDYTTNTVVSSIAVAKTPLAGAISMDYHWLYVTSSGTPTLTVIDLTQGQVAQSVTLPSTPQGVEVGNDGRALISLLGTGVVSGVPQGTLLVFDRTQQSASNQLTPVVVPALPTTPVPIPAPTLPRPVTTFSGKLLRTPNGQFIVGVITPTAATSYVFVYEVASGVVLHNRTISGASSVLSMAPDGSRFMAGATMYDIATLAVVAQQNNANAPFTFAGAINTAQNTGGSVFSPDGTTLYSAFNTAATTTPPPPSLSSTLLVNDSTGLGIRLGIKLPESIVARIVMMADGSQAWGLSDSGLIHLPLGNLYTYPILMPQTTDVFLAIDDCDRGIASGTLEINNLGAGKLTFTVSTATSGALVYQQSSGVAPATVTFSMEPGRSGVVRSPGTNIWTGAGTSAGTPFAVTLASPNAINIPNLIRVYMNYRLPDQRGVIYPLPTTPNSNSGGNANPNGNEGLQDMVLDEPHQKLYLTNSGLNRIEVFDLQKQYFLNPIPVGQMPHQMALGTDGNTLYVGNTGGESIGIVDLTLQQVVNNVVFPPLPRNGTVNPINPRALAVGLFGLEFLMSDGSQWNLVGTTAIPRPANTVTPVLLAGCPACAMMATPDNQYILTLNGSGTAYIYDGTADTYVASRLLFPAPIEGYYGVLGAGPAGSYFLANGLTLSPSLTTIGGSAIPLTGGRNVTAVAPLGATSFLELTTPVKASATATVTGESRTTLQMVNVATGNATTVAVVPENPVVTVVGTARFNTAPRQLVVNAAGTTAYAITLSGLSVVSLTPTGASTLPTINATRGVVNSNDGTTTNIQPGSFITITGANLASTATAETIPPPTVLGGSCVTFGDISVPLLATSSNQILAQVPDTLLPGTQVVEVRSLAKAQDSAPVTVVVRAATTGSPVSPASDRRRPGGQ
jgi:DNA-binding beta-propeller fold protein YncE